MDILTISELQSLIDFQANPCVSIYMSSPKRRSTQEKMLRYRRLLKQVEKNLACNFQHKIVKEIMSPLQFFSSLDPLIHTAPGFCCFSARGISGFFPLDKEVEEIVCVEDTFYLAPILHLLKSEETLPSYTPNFLPSYTSPEPRPILR